MEYISNNVKETSDVARGFLDTLKQKEGGALVIGLSGELGAGKTTFMKAFAESFGITEIIQSPTFVIMKRYELVSSSKHSESRFKNLIHVDAYRLESGEDLKNLGWDEIVADKNNIICIEWPERVTGILPRDFVNIKFEHLSLNSRKIVLNYES